MATTQMMAPAPVSAQRTIPGLDGLRGISIFLVIVSHARDTTGFPSYIPAWLTDYSGLGVKTFFVISGFLITRLLLSEKAAHGNIKISSFYMRRILRIMPAFLVFMLAMFILRSGGWLHISTVSFVAALTYTLNFLPSPSWCLGHIWSLSVEEQFYFIWPAILAFCSNRLAICAALVVLIVSPVLMGIFYFLHLSFAVVASVRWFPLVADGMAIGSLLAFALPAVLKSKQCTRVLYAPAGWLLLPVLFCVYNLRNHPRLFFPIGEWALLLMIGYFVCRVTTSRVRFLEGRLLTFVGMLSYSLYLWQQPFLTPHAPYWLNRFPQNIVCAIAMAGLSQILIERPALLLKKHFSRTIGPACDSASLHAR